MRTQSAFTLVELMVTVTIISISLAAIYHTFSTGILAWERGEENMANQQEIRQTLHLITKEIRSSFISLTDDKTRLLGENIEENGANSDRLTFYTLSDPNPMSSRRQVGLFKVSYYLEEDESNQTFCLMRKETPAIGENNFDEEVTDILLGRVPSLNFEYFYGDEWKDSWEVDRRLPLRVKITLITDGAGGKHHAFTTVTDVPASDIDILLGNESRPPPPPVFR